VLMASAALLISGRGAWAGGESAIAWRKSLPAAQAEAKQSHKLLMVDFYTSWCGYCKKLDAEVYTDANIIRLSSQVVAVKVDAEHEGQTLARKYQVRGFPTILFLNEAGGVEGMIGGYLPPVGFAQNFSDTMKRHQNFVAAQTRYHKNSNDVQAAFDLEGFYVAQGNSAQTIAMQQQVERLDPQNAKGILSRSVLSLGDFYSMRGQFDKSVSLYRRAIHITKAPHDMAYGHLSIAYCDLSQKRLKQALPELQAVRAVPNCPLDIKGEAQKLIAQLKEHGVQ
jgi:thioredoxin-related protein